MTRWLLLIYKVPNEPSARRVYVWRKLKAMGALLVQDSAWVLPANSRTRERMQWLATEIKDMEGGQATLWEAEVVFTGQESDFTEQFTAQVDSLYRDLLRELERDDADLPTLSKKYQQAKLQDYFDSPLGEQTREILIQRRGGQS
jgi:hypothetical protein